MTRTDAAPKRPAASAALLVGVIAWLATFALLLLATAAFTGSAPASSDAPPITRAGSKLTPNNANARPQGEVISIANRSESPLTILAVGTQPFKAADYGVASVESDAVPRGIELALIWVRADEPDRPHEQPIEISGTRAMPTALDRNPEWRGDIRFLALGVKGVMERPLTVASFRLESLGTTGTLGDIVRGWLHLERWDGRSINFLFGGREIQRAWLPPLGFLASLVAGLAVWLHARRRGERLALTTLSIPFLLGWLLLDLRWQANLVRQARETLADFGGRTWEQRHLAMDDADLFRFVQAARAKLPEQPVRVFATSDFEYFRRRAGYHLYPHNVLAYNWAEPGVIRPGDYVLFYQKNDVRFDTGAGELRWNNGQRLKAQVVIARRGAGLFIAKSQGE